MSAYTEAVLADKPLLYLRQDGSGSGKETDHGTLGLTGTYHGTVAEVAGALEASGDNDKATGWTGDATDWLSVPANAGLNLATAVTVEAWAYSSEALVGTSHRAIFEKTNGSNVRGYALFLQSEEPRHFIWTIRKSNGIEFTDEAGELTLNAWHHIVGTYDHEHLRLYHNGALIVEKAVAIEIGTGEGESLIGLQAGGFYPAKGRIDEVAVYGTALSQARIEAHYKAAITPPAGHGHIAIANQRQAQITVQ